MNQKLEFLQETAPYNLLPSETLEHLTAHLEEVSFDQSDIIYQQHRTKVDGIDLLVKGKYEVFFFNSNGSKQAYNTVTTGGTYGAFSILMNKGRSISTVSVKKNTKIYKISGELFKELCKQNDPFYQHFLALFGKEMLNDQFANFVTNPSIDVETLSFDRYFVRRLDTVSTRAIISCHPDTPCQEAARLMEEHKLSCLFVKGDSWYEGYVTDIILRNKIVGEDRHSHTPVKEVMEGPIYTISRNAFVYEAVLMMFDNMIRYVIVQENGEDVGVLSRNKLLSDQAQSPFVFIQSVRLALSLDEIKNKWNQVPEVAYQLLSRGVKSEIVNQVITNISDSIAQKIIDGVIHEIGPPPAKFAFMSLGSEGRREQTLKTDQDNAIIYEDKANEFREKTRTYFLHLADLVSERLNYIGFAFCTGGLMAKNPKWTHSLSHWKRNYNEWIESPNPESVMNFSTFFDCRIIYGDEQLIDELQSHILQKLNEPSDYFFTQLTKNALQYEAPLTFFKGIRTISKGERKVFNIKRAMTPIVDLVRVYALKHKILQTNTGDRLIALREQDIFSEEDFHELMQSYYYLMGMRLKHQALQIINDREEPHNYVSPESLTKIEIVTIKEIFKVIETFQQRIKMVFTRNLFG